MSRAKGFLAKNDYSRALLEFRSAAKNQPNNPEPLYQAALIYIELGDFQAAANYLLRATKVDPSYSPAQLRLAELMAVNADPTVVREAERRAELALSSSASTADAINTMALAEMRLNEPENAEKHLREALAKFPKNLQASVLMATLKLNQKDPASAESVLKNAVAQEPKSVEARVALARFYLLQNAPDDAEIHYRAALELDSRSAMALSDLADVDRSRGKKAESEALFKRLAALSDPQFNYRYAQFLFAQGRQEEALHELERLAKADPKSRVARSRLVAGYLAAKQFPAAEKVLTQVLKENGKDVDALIQRTQIYLLSGKLQEATADLNKSLQYQPNSGKAHYLMARVNRAQGAMLNSRRELTEALRCDPSLMIARFDLAESLLRASDPKAALELLKAAPKDQLNLMPMLIQQNWALLAAGQLDEVREGVNKARALGDAPELHMQAGIIALQQKQFVQARTQFEEALKLAPEDIRALQLLAQSFAVENKRDAGTVRLRAYADSRPKSTVVRHFLGSWLAANGKLDEARTEFLAAKAIDPGFVPSDLALAQIDLTQGNLNRAYATLAGVVKNNEGEVGARLLMGMVDELAGRYDSAIADYRAVIQAEPTNSVALNNLSYRLSATTKADEAIQFALAAVKLNPKNLAFKDTLGWAYYQRGTYRNAVEQLVASVQENAPVRSYHLAMAYSKLGDTVNARRTLEKALQLNAKLPEAKMAQEMIHVR